jgi:hypothetical protein
MAATKAPARRGDIVGSVTPEDGAASAIADPTGGATIDAQSRTAIAAIIDALEAAGLVTPS